MATDSVQEQFVEVFGRLGRNETRVLLEDRGTPVAAIVSADDLRRLDQLDDERSPSFAVIDEMRAAFRDVPAEEISFAWAALVTPKPAATIGQ
jgi:hypothetical protein